MGSDGLNEEEMMLIFLVLILFVAIGWIVINKGWSLDGIVAFYDKLSGTFNKFMG